MKLYSGTQKLFAIFCLGASIQVVAQPLSDDEFDGLNRPGMSPTTTQSLPSGEGSKISEFPKLGDYVELDDSIKNEMYGTIDFPNAELKDIIKAISKLANKNFILDRKIENKKVTIISPQPVTKQEAYNAFLSSLYMNDLTIVSMGKFLKIIESKNALQSNIRVFYGDSVPASEEIVTALYKLNYLNVEEIQRYLNDLIARSGRVSFYPNTNTLVMTDTGLNLRKIISILKQIDVAGHEDQLESIPIRYASAKGISTLVGEILDAQSGARRAGGAASQRNQPQKTRGGGIITKIVPDERTNSLVVLANGRGVIELKSLVAKLDTPDAAGGGNIHIYYCKNAVAEDLSKTITALISGVSKPDSKSTGSRAADTPSILPAANTPIRAGGGEESIKFEGNIKVTFDKPTNALVVVASGADFSALKTILQKLDIPRRQVYVEATIMEIFATDNSQFGAGVNLAQNNIGQVAGFRPEVGFPSATELASIASTPAALSGLVGVIGLGRKVTVGSISISSVSGLIRALQSSKQANILHQPQVLTSDNEEASIEVKNRLAVKTGTTYIGTTQTPQDTFGKEDVTISLKITPQIGKDNDLIRLKVEQQIDDFTESEKTTGQYDTNQRKANTMVVVRNGDTIVVGGLQKNTTNDSSSKFPLLGDLPILGWLFKGRSSDVKKSNLILFLTPHIINEYSDLVNITQNKIEERSDFGKKLFDPTDRLKNETQKIRSKVLEDKKKAPPKGWSFKSRSEALENESAETSAKSESAFIQPTSPTTPAVTLPPADSANTVDSKLRGQGDSNNESYNTGGFIDDEELKKQNPAVR